MRVPTKKRFAAAFIFVSSVILTAYFCIPILNRTNALLDLLNPVFQETTPIVHYSQKTIDFDRPVPYSITLENGVQVLFKEQADSLYMTTLPAFSVSIAKDKIVYNTKSETKSIPVEDIEIDKDPIIIKPVVIGDFLNKYSPLIVTIFAVLLLISFFLVLSLITLALAGIGIMIDAFTEGQYTFAGLFNLASISILLATLVWTIFRFSTLIHLRFSIIVLAVVFVVFVYGSDRLWKKNTI